MPSAISAALASADAGKRPCKASYSSMASCGLPRRRALAALANSSLALAASSGDVAFTLGCGAEGGVAAALAFGCGACTEGRDVGLLAATGRVTFRSAAVGTGSDNPN